jgi:hypothetical protein
MDRDYAGQAGRIHAAISSMTGGLSGMDITVNRPA